MIQWYPGHMHKANKEFKKILPQVDIVIEVLDARIPFSSQNPLLASMRKHKPTIKILNKSDLSDELKLAQWQAELEQDSTVKTLTCNNQGTSYQKLVGLCRSLVPERNNRGSMVYAMIAGIPNVGKSTIINALAGRAIAKTANEAAVTKMQQRIEISPQLTLIDTPGVLWPNIDNENSGFRLAATGAIKDTALDLQDIACFVAEFLLETYPSSVQSRYGLEQLPKTEIELLEVIARKRGCIVSGGMVDFEKVSRIIISDLRSGGFDGICMETPELMRQELAQLEVLRAQKIENAKEKKANKKSRPSRR
jgi:ribosome biogenesis GTPase A